MTHKLKSNQSRLPTLQSAVLNLLCESSGLLLEQTTTKFVFTIITLPKRLKLLKSILTISGTLLSTQHCLTFYLVQMMTQLECLTGIKIGPKLTHFRTMSITLCSSQSILRTLQCLPQPHLINALRFGVLVQLKQLLITH